MYGSNVSGRRYIRHVPIGRIGCKVLRCHDEKREDLEAVLIKLTAPRESWQEHLDIKLYQDALGGVLRLMTMLCGGQKPVTFRSEERGGEALVDGTRRIADGSKRVPTAKNEWR